MGDPDAMIHLHPISIREAKEFVRQHHRHNKPPAGAKFAIGCGVAGTLVGVSMVGRPVARMLAARETAEVLRLCVAATAPKNTCSMLYGASWRAWRAMGGRRLITYTLASETGASLRAAGFKIVANTKAEEWSRPSRARTTQPVYGEPKHRWEVAS
jgi:hypothetical protein